MTLVDPVRLLLFRRPVLTNTHITLELCTLYAFLTSGQTCPVTRKKLRRRHRPDHKTYTRVISFAAHTRQYIPPLEFDELVRHIALYDTLACEAACAMVDDVSIGVLSHSIVRAFLTTVQDSNVLDVATAHALMSFEAATVQMGVDLMTQALLEGRCMRRSLSSLEFQKFAVLKLSLASSSMMCSCCSLTLECDFTFT